MKKLITQTGKSATCDFEEKTWVFEMDSDFKVIAGKFAIIPKENYDSLITAYVGMINSMMAHPDNEPDSEFCDMINRAIDVLDFIR